MPAPVRQDLEARILAGKSIGGPDYRYASGGGRLAKWHGD
jgi:hypothetical protein